MKEKSTQIFMTQGAKRRLPTHLPTIILIDLVFRTGNYYPPVLSNKKRQMSKYIIKDIEISSNESNFLIGYSLFLVSLLCLIRKFSEFLLLNDHIPTTLKKYFLHSLFYVDIQCSSGHLQQQYKQSVCTLIKIEVNYKLKQKFQTTSQIGRTESVR